MLVFDQLKKNDLQLQLLAAAICVGLGVLFTGLWWVQIVSSSRYQESLETQSYKTVRVPAARGKIFDRNGLLLAENRPNYNINLYLEDLRPAFQAEFKASRPRKVVTNSLPFWKKWIGISAVSTNLVPLTSKQRATLERDSRYRAASNVVARISTILKTPMALSFTNFTRHYSDTPFLPYPVATNLQPAQFARFEEQAINLPGAELEVQSVRNYPCSNVTAHVLGYVKRKNDSVVNEQSYYDHRLLDFTGLVGIEGRYDPAIHGSAGENVVVINNLGYRQSETVVNPVEPGTNVHLTLDVRIQAAAEASLRLHPNSGRGAAVVMDVLTGDILAMVSSPSMDPNYFIKGFPGSEYERWNDEKLGYQNNRAAAGRYQPGSIFKTVVALAALETPEARFDPNEKYHVELNPQTGKGIYVGKGFAVKDTVPSGDYDLRRAISQSSNAYFVSTGLRPGVFPRMLLLGQRLHLGERVGLPLMLEISGTFPKPEQGRKLPIGEIANICIGGGGIDVTPTQVAVLIAAIANGGTVLKPRMVDRLESQDPTTPGPFRIEPKGVVRDHLGVSKRSLDILRDAMLSETESAEGTGRRVLDCGFRVCGKTGTAERFDRGVKKNTTWFASFAPYESPRYAVVVALEDGVAGGPTCSPIARDIYVALKAIDAEYTGRNATATTR